MEDSQLPRLWITAIFCSYQLLDKFIASEDENWLKGRLLTLIDFFDFLFMQLCN